MKKIPFGSLPPIIRYLMACEETRHCLQSIFGERYTIDFHGNIISSLNDTGSVSKMEERLAENYASILDDKILSCDLLISLLAAADDVFEEMLQYKNHIYFRDDSDIAALRSLVIEVDVYNEMMNWGGDLLRDRLHLLKDVDFIYRFFLARKFSHVSGDAPLHQSRLSGWGREYVDLRLRHAPDGLFINRFRAVREQLTRELMKHQNIYRLIFENLQKKSWPDRAAMSYEQLKVKIVF